MPTEARVRAVAILASEIGGPCSRKVSGEGGQPTCGTVGGRGCGLDACGDLGSPVVPSRAFGNRAGVRSDATIKQPQEGDSEQPRKDEGRFFTESQEIVPKKPETGG